MRAPNRERDRLDPPEPNLSTAPLAGRDSVVRATATATLAGGLGFATTLVQQLVLARELGLSASVDALAASIAWAVSTTGVVGWTIASLTVPLYAPGSQRDPVEAKRLAQSASFLATAGGLALASGTFLWADAIASILLPGSPASTRHELASLLRIGAPLHLAWTIWIFVSSIANARRRYVTVALVTVVQPLTVIGTVLAEPTVEAVTIAYAVGITTQIIFLIASGGSWRADLRPTIHTSALRNLRIGIVPIALFYVMNSVGLLIARVAASMGGPGDVAALDYGIRLTTVGEAVLLTGALAITMTVWSEDRATRANRLPPLHAIGATLIVGVVVAATLMVLATPIVSLLFAGGQFSLEDVDKVAAGLAAVAPGMAARMVMLVASRLLLARQATWLLAGALGVGLAGVAIGSYAGEIVDGLRGAAAGYSMGWVLAATLSVLAVRKSGVQDAGSVVQRDG